MVMCQFNTRVNKPAFFIDVTTEEPEATENKSEVCSVYKESITEIEAR